MHVCIAVKWATLCAEDVHTFQLDTANVYTRSAFTPVTFHTILARTIFAACAQPSP